MKDTMLNFYAFFFFFFTEWGKAGRAFLELSDIDMENELHQPS